MFLINRRKLESRDLKMERKRVIYNKIFNKTKNNYFRDYLQEVEPDLVKKIENIFTNIIWFDYYFSIRIKVREKCQSDKAKSI